MGLLFVAARPKPDDRANLAELRAGALALENARDVDKCLALERDRGLCASVLRRTLKPKGATVTVRPGGFDLGS